MSKDFTVVSEGTVEGNTQNSGGPWTWNSLWCVNGSTLTYSSILVSYTIPIRYNGELFFDLIHTYDFQVSALVALDGGNVSISRNSGKFTLVSFTSNGYNLMISPFSSNPLAGQPVFSGNSGGTSTPAKIISSTSLGVCTVNDTIILKFNAGWNDMGLLRPSPNWMLHQIKLYSQ